jgi:hypothetical protein
VRTGENRPRQFFDRTASATGESRLRFEIEFGPAEKRFTRCSLVNRGPLIGLRSVAPPLIGHWPFAFYGQYHDNLLTNPS